MNSAQQNYTTTEKEILSIAATLKSNVYILNIERVMRWRLMLEEFGPELKYIKVENNVVADALSCLIMSDNQDILNIYELYG